MYASWTSLFKVCILESSIINIELRINHMYRELVMHISSEYGAAVGLW
jgi:hypothetical protein